jgi:CheY-like chemotaxis protein
MHGPPEILSVGHNPTLLAFRHLLLKKAGYAVTSAALPVKAMDLLSTHSFDLILVGLAAHAERIAIERLNKDNQVPVIFLCCDQFDPTTGACMCQQARLSPEELLRKIADALSDGMVH